MTTTLQIADRTIAAEELISLLAHYQIIPQVICENIIDRAIDSVQCTPDEIAQACAEFCQQRQLNSDAIQQSWMQQYGLDQQQLEQLATRRLRINKFKQQMWAHKLESYFLQRKRQLDQIIYSIIQVEDREIASELFFRIQEGEQSFSELARLYSQGPMHGVVGPIELGQLPVGLREFLYTRPIGEIQPPVASGEFQVIVRVERLIPAQLDEPMRQRLLHEQFEAWFDAQVEQLPTGDKIWMGALPKDSVH
jgi:parvulin-like peptidyl-prolyl isomerase